MSTFPMFPCMVAAALLSLFSACLDSSLNSLAAAPIFSVLPSVCSGCVESSDISMSSMLLSFFSLSTSSTLSLIW